jgi:hypothetical protein
MLNRVNFPLTKAQVSDFILEREYTNFLNLQQAIGELIDASMIKAESSHDHTHLSLTPDGIRTVSYFGGRISELARAEIDEYLRHNELELRNEVSITSAYKKTAPGEYQAHLSAKDNGISLVDITLSVPAEETAVQICDNWRTNNQEIYQYLIRALF